MDACDSCLLYTFFFPPKSTIKFELGSVVFIVLPCLFHSLVITFYNHMLTSPVGALNKKSVNKVNLKPEVRVLIPRLIGELCTRLTLSALGQI